MKELYNKLMGSFDNEPKGFSSKKLTAFILILLVVSVHIKWMVLGNFTQLEMVLTIDYTFIASLFGMTTFQAMKSQSKSSVSTTEQENSDTTSKITITNEQIGGDITPPTPPIPPVTTSDK